MNTKRNIPFSPPDMSEAERKEGRGAEAVGKPWHIVSSVGVCHARGVEKFG